jgi:hypothetical protein
MNTTKKIAIGLGIASGALLATWLLTGNRPRRTRKILSEKTLGLTKRLQKKQLQDEAEMQYV